MASYKLEVTLPNIDKAFRRAAAENDVDGMHILEGKVTHINAQDDNPINKKTALHWAIIKESTEAMKYLLAKHARTDIHDASGRTAIDYAKVSKNGAIRSLVIRNEELESIHASQLNK